jgi:hypothetical protein
MSLYLECREERSGIGDQGTGIRDGVNSPKKKNAKMPSIQMPLT